MPKQTQPIIKIPTVLDIFSGADGMSLGFQNAGCDILGGIDNNPHAVRTHNINFPKCKLKIKAQDIRAINLKDKKIKPGEVVILYHLFWQKR